MSPVLVLSTGRPNKMLCQQWHMLSPTTPAVTTLLQRLTKCLPKTGHSSTLSVGLLLMQCVLTHLLALSPFVMRFASLPQCKLVHVASCKAGFKHRHALGAFSMLQCDWSSKCSSMAAHQLSTKHVKQLVSIVHVLHHPGYY